MAGWERNQERAFLPVRPLPWIGACLLGGAIVVVIGATCLYAATYGGPAWMAGREVSVFLKLSALTAVAVVADICWRAFSPVRAEGDGGGDHETSLVEPVEGSTSHSAQ